MLEAGHRRTAVLKGFAPARICTAREAFEHSERRFTRLQAFAFSSDDTPQMVSSGPRHAGWSIALVKSTGHRIALGDDKVSLLFPYRGKIHVQRRNAESEAGPDELLIVAPGQRTTSLSSGYLGMLIQIPIEAFDALQADAGVKTRRTIEHIPAGHPASLAAFEATRILERDQPLLQTQDAWSRFVAPIFTSAAHRDRPDGTGRALPRSQQHVHAAEAFMLANLHRRLSAADIAHACGVRSRALQGAFAHYRRRSPMEVLNDLRLQEASHSLKAADRSGSVTEIALDYGFTHLGRFGASYKRFFGERPSTAARRAKGRN